MSQKVTVKLLGVDVMDVIAPPGVEVEVQQYKKEDQEAGAPRFHEVDWPGLVFTYAWPMSKAKPKRTRGKKKED